MYIINKISCDNQVQYFHNSHYRTLQYYRNAIPAMIIILYRLKLKVGLFGFWLRTMKFRICKHMILVSHSVSFGKKTTKDSLLIPHPENDFFTAKIRPGAYYWTRNQKYAPGGLFSEKSGTVCSFIRQRFLTNFFKIIYDEI